MVQPVSSEVPVGCNVILFSHTNYLALLHRRLFFFSIRTDLYLICAFYLVAHSVNTKANSKVPISSSRIPLNHDHPRIRIIHKHSDILVMVRPISLFFLDYEQLRKTSQSNATISIFIIVPSVVCNTDVESPEIHPMIVQPHFLS